MSTIKQKLGICIDCSDTRKKPVMAKRCTSGPHYHYQAHKRSIYASRSTKRANSKNSSSGLSKWFQMQISLMPSTCQECGDYLNHNAIWGPKAYVAHILPKRHFESVSTHPLNCVFLCVRCHTNYDTWGVDKVSLMKVFPFILQRLSHFMKHVQQDEYGHLPAFPSIDDMIDRTNT